MQNDKEMTRSVQCSVILVSQERYHYLASDGIDTQKLDFGYPNSNRYSIRNKSTESTAEIHKSYDFQNLKIPTIWYAIAIITRSTYHYHYTFQERSENDPFLNDVVEICQLHIEKFTLFYIVFLVILYWTQKFLFDSSLVKKYCHLNISSCCVNVRAMLRTLHNIQSLRLKI